MRSVFTRVPPTATLAVLIVLLATTAAAAAPRDRQADRFIDRVITWLQSRISIPPGNG